VGEPAGAETIAALKLAERMTAGVDMTNVCLLDSADETPMLRADK
jgi:hypothetical protein